MSDEAINKFLCEKVEKKMWLEDDWWDQNPDYLHSGDDYIRLMQAASQKEWWVNFIDSLCSKTLRTTYYEVVGNVGNLLLTPSRGVRALAEFLGYKEDEK